MVGEEQRKTPRNQKKASKAAENGGMSGVMISPSFKSAAALAGWDEEALLFASLVVQDTPERTFKHPNTTTTTNNPSHLNLTTPPTYSRSRKRRAQRGALSVSATVLDLHQLDTPTKGSVKRRKGERGSANEAGAENKEICDSSSSGSALPCLEKLREELTCAICLEMCFEPSTTPCGHSFCRKCLRFSADKCGRKCPRCRTQIGNGRSCTVNTVLWNTIQLLFPKEVEERKAAGALNPREAQNKASPETAFYNNLRNPTTTRTLGASNRSTRSQRRRVMITTTTQDDDDDAALARRLQMEENEAVQNNNNSRNQTPSSSSRRRRSRRMITNQDEDAAIALRLQREEFMQVFRGSQAQAQAQAQAQPRSVSLSSATANLRAMASRASLRVRDRSSRL